MPWGGSSILTPSKRANVYEHEIPSPSPVRLSREGLPGQRYLHHSRQAYQTSSTPRKHRQSDSYPYLHHPFPSPPSSTPSPVAFLEAYVESADLRSELRSWQEAYLPRPTLSNMTLPVSVSDGLEASWRSDSSAFLDRSASGSRSGSAQHSRGASLTAARDDPFGTDEPLPAARSHLVFDAGAAVKASRTSGGKASGPAVVGPLPIAVLASLMDTSKGRDKVLKIAQYSIRTYLYVLSLLSVLRPLAPWFRSNTKRMRLAVSSLSLTRKCLLLMNPLHPLTHLLSPSPASATSIIGHLIDLASAVSDDLYCLSRLGIVNKRLGAKADRWANRFWLLNTLIGLYKLHLSTMPRLRSRAARNQDVGTADEIRAEMKAAQWTGRKLLADLVFVSYDVFKLTWFEEPVKCLAGLTAALISTNKLYEQHWRASLGKG